MLRVFPYGALQFVSYEQYKNVSSQIIISVVFVLSGEDFSASPMCARSFPNLQPIVGMQHNGKLYLLIADSCLGCLVCLVLQWQFSLIAAMGQKSVIKFTVIHLVCPASRELFQPIRLYSFITWLFKMVVSNKVEWK